jgi:uncharacterized protein YkwD
MLLAAILALTGTLVLTAALAETSRAGRRSPCAQAGLAPIRLGTDDLRAAVLCLVNRARERHGLSSLHDDRDLRISATRHSTDMVEREYFAHDGLDGGTLGDRLGRTRYLHRTKSYLVGENIGGGRGSRSGSAAAVFQSWMHSPPHRANILSPYFQDFGAGVARGFPGNGRAGAATYTLDFGTRR